MTPPLYPARLWRVRLRRARRGTLAVLFLGVCAWGILTYRADHQTFAWDRRLNVAIVAVIDDLGPERDDDQRFAERFLSGAESSHEGIRSVERWLDSEHERHTARAGRAFSFDVWGPIRVSGAPPAPPGDDAPLLERWWMMRSFLAFFHEAAREARLPSAGYDVTLFLYFYDFSDRDRRAVFSRLHSLAVRRERLGVVFAPIARRLAGNTCALVAHELLHVLGASDKYRGSASVFPDGFADPTRTPLYPQERAEIMALGRPLEPGKDESVLAIDACAVGAATAREIRWVPR